MSVYAFSDLHAQYDLWRQIKEYIKPDDIVYCLGDCVDRGPASLEILNEVMKTPNIILLRGNHEDFIVSIGSELLKYKYEDEDIDYELISLMRLWEDNGAKNTIKAFKKLTIAKKKWLIEDIQKLPTHAEYINTKGDIIYLCHAGRRPDTVETPDMRRGDIPMNNYIWDRNHIYEKHWKGKDNEYCVHGHTPIEYMYDFINPECPPPASRFEIFKYCDGHKIDIDLGSFETHTACLLDLDTFEPIYFKDRTILDEEWDRTENGVI